MPTLDEQFMSLALELAENGRGAVEPNPMVGAVLVRDGVEIARGWHRRFGWPHAEVEALASAEQAGQDPQGATLYVSLEPCCHFGKTPPCTRAIIDAGIARVVAALTDPDDRVAGKGFDELRRAGIEVTSGVLEGKARELLAPYIKLRRHRRPWVICKWAQTEDGLLAMPAVGEGAMLPPGAMLPQSPAEACFPSQTRGGMAPDAGKMPAGRKGETRTSKLPTIRTPPRWISGEQSRRDVHRLRALCDAILVGVGTVLADDPLLTNRSGAGRQPARIILDAHLRTPPKAWLVQTAKDSPVLLATTLEGLAAGPAKAAELRQAGVELLQLPADPEGVNLPALLDELGRRQWTYLIVEGGAKVLRSFVYGNLADELAVYTAPEKADAPGPRFDIAQVQADLELKLMEERPSGRDTKRRFRVKQG